MRNVLELCEMNLEQEKRERGSFVMLCAGLRLHRAKFKLCMKTGVFIL